MNESDRSTLVKRYLDEVAEQFHSGHAIEHAYRPALKQLISGFEDTTAVNDPKHSEHGAPDFIFLKKSNNKIIKGYAEAKDITVNLDKTEKTEQMTRYGGYANLFLTDYLEFRFFRNGEKYETISLGSVINGQIHLTPENADRLVRELEAFLEQPPEKIKNGKRLAQIMGGKAHRIRDNVAFYLGEDTETSAELEKIYKMMKKMLVHDLKRTKFADMYAQTLVYGLFVARYADKTPESFDRSEARDLVPKSNPFLRHFFDHIVGADFDTRLGYIVDELCEVFGASDVAEIVHKHLRIQDDTSEVKDPIIHFYEDFLNEYDRNERKEMGAYYTPIPVAKYIIRQVDAALKNEFGIVDGLASAETVKRYIETGQDLRVDRRGTKQTGYYVDSPRVQILDPAVGTATFLNEIVKYVHADFKGQEGRWPGYVKDSLIKRLSGFELMMAPYTIAHLKLGMTLRETGVDNLQERLGVYLTNTLEEGIELPHDLFSFGLAEAVSDESRAAAEIKTERPVMVIIGNPPYSVSSNNKSKWIESLMTDYKKGVVTSKNTQPLSDDYLKFIRFAQHMVDKNGSGVVGYICNRSFLDGIVHHKVRELLLNTFDSIKIVDLNGDNTRNQALNDKIDRSVFDIKQGTCIILLIKTGKPRLQTVNYVSLRGSRDSKFKLLNEDIKSIPEITLHPTGVDNFFVDKNLSDQSYKQHVSIGELFTVHSSAIATSNDAELVATHKNSVYKLDFYYRPFDKRYINYDIGRVKGNRYNQLVRHLVSTDLSEFYDNYILTCSKNVTTPDFTSVLMSDGLTERKYSDYSRGPHLFPLYIYDSDGVRSSNFNTDALSTLMQNVTATYTPEDVLNYIYGLLYSPAYREQYNEFLKIDFPRIPTPTDNEWFNHLSSCGRDLRDLHLMKSPLLNKLHTTFPVVGTNYVEKPHYEAGQVWINSIQYVGNVPESAWNYSIGGYQPAQKWLKDRKECTLSDAEVVHYQKIITVLLETEKITRKIDNN